MPEEERPIVAITWTMVAPGLQARGSSKSMPLSLSASLEQFVTRFSKPRLAASEEPVM